MDSNLRSLIIGRIKSHLAIQQIERESLVEKAEDYKISTLEKTAALGRIAKIEGETHNMISALDVLLEEEPSLAVEENLLEMNV